MDRQVFWQINIYTDREKAAQLFLKIKYLPKASYISILLGNTGSPSVLCCIDLEKPVILYSSIIASITRVSLLCWSFTIV